MLDRVFGARRLARIKVASSKKRGAAPGRGRAARRAGAPDLAKISSFEGIHAVMKLVSATGAPHESIVIVRPAASIRSRRPSRHFCARSAIMIVIIVDDGVIRRRRGICGDIGVAARKW